MVLCCALWEEMSCMRLLHVYPWDFIIYFIFYVFMYCTVRASSSQTQMLAKLDNLQLSVEEMQSVSQASKEHIPSI